MTIEKVRSYIRKSKEIKTFLLIGREAGIHVPVKKQDAMRALDALICEVGLAGKVPAIWDERSRVLYLGGASHG